MSKFTQSLRVEFSPTKYRYATLLEDLEWDVDEEGSGRKIRIPAGFTSDGVSSPKILWSFLPPWGHPSTRAALLHDYILDSMQDRDLADSQFYLALLATGSGKRISYVVWAIVRSYTYYLKIGRLFRKYTT